MQCKPECTTFTRFAFHFDRAIHKIDKVFTDGQPKAGASQFRRAFFLHEGGEAHRRQTRDFVDAIREGREPAVKRLFARSKPLAWR